MFSYAREDIHEREKKNYNMEENLLENSCDGHF